MLCLSWSCVAVMHVCDCVRVFVCLEGEYRLIGILSGWCCRFHFSVSSHTGNLFHFPFHCWLIHTYAHICIRSCSLFRVWIHCNSNGPMYVWSRHICSYVDYGFNSCMVVFGASWIHFATLGIPWMCAPVYQTRILIHTNYTHSHSHIHIQSDSCNKRIRYSEKQIYCLAQKVTLIGDGSNKKKPINGITNFQIHKKKKKNLFFFISLTDRLAILFRPPFHFTSHIAKCRVVAYQLGQIKWPLYGHSSLLFT